MENLPSTVREPRGRADVNEILLEDIENMFWSELTVPALEDSARDEGETLWKCLEADLPEIVYLARAFHARQDTLQLQAQLARSQHQKAYNNVFRLRFEEGVVREIVELLALAIFSTPRKQTHCT